MEFTKEQKNSSEESLIKLRDKVISPAGTIILDLTTKVKVYHDRNEQLEALLRKCSKDGSEYETLRKNLRELVELEKSWILEYGKILQEQVSLLYDSVAFFKYFLGVHVKSFGENKFTKDMRKLLESCSGSFPMVEEALEISRRYETERLKYLV